jgi:hypothetical protein
MLVVAGQAPTVTREGDVMSIQASPPPAPVIVVQQGNGLGVAGFVCGLVGALAGLIPLLFFIAFPLGTLGVAFGFIGWRRAVHDPLRGSKGLALAGLILGVVALGLAVVGIVIVDNAFS